MRVAYTLLWWLALPFLPLRLWWRGRREPSYRSHVGERFGRYAGAARAVGNDVVWIHAVSLGETRAVAPLIERLERDNPRRTILLTHMTATGRDAGRALFGNRVVQAWLPYDLPSTVSSGTSIRARACWSRPSCGRISRRQPREDACRCC